MGGGQIYDSLQGLYKSFLSLTALDMAKTNQNSIFYFRGKIDFENLLVLEKKQLENLPLEQNIFVLKKLSVNLGGG